MEELKNNKYYKWCLWSFIVITCVHIFYAVITMRGMYIDGAFYFIKLLNSFANNNLYISTDIGHPRYFIWLLTQVPVIFANFVLFLHNKYALMMLYTFTQLALPLILIFLQYKLSKRTGRLDLYFWSLFSYCLLMLPFSIFSMVETPAATILIFILINYLVSQIDYTKKDIWIITLLVIGLSNSMEFFIFIGPMLLFASFYYASKEELLKNIAVKLLIGIGSLLSTLYLTAFTMTVPDQANEILRFAGEAFDFYPFLFKLCSLLSVGAVITLFVFLFKKDKMSPVSFSAIIIINLLLFIRLVLTPQDSLSPVLEGHLRTIPFWAVPAIVWGIFLFDFFKGKINPVKFQNYLCIVLITGSFLACWQMINTYFWYKNLQYMKAELSKAETLLYLPFEHEEISGFFNPQFRRYIWHNVYTPMSILFSPSYKQKTLLTGYEEEATDGNLSLREKLYIPPNTENKLFIPMGAEIDIKNRYWDLTDVSEALKEYNLENNIKTER